MIQKPPLYRGFRYIDGPYYRGLTVYLNTTSYHRAKNKLSIMHVEDISLN